MSRRSRRRAARSRPRRRGPPSAWAAQGSAGMRRSALPRRRSLVAPRTGAFSRGAVGPGGALRRTSGRCRRSWARSSPRRCRRDTRRTPSRRTAGDRRQRRLPRRMSRPPMRRCPPRALSGLSARAGSPPSRRRPSWRGCSGSGFPPPSVLARCPTRSPPGRGRRQRFLCSSPSCRRPRAATQRRPWRPPTTGRQTAPTGRSGGRELVGLRASWPLSHRPLSYVWHIPHARAYQEITWRDVDSGVPQPRPRTTATARGMRPARGHDLDRGRPLATRLASGQGRPTTGGSARRPRANLGASEWIRARERRQGRTRPRSGGATRGPD